MSVLLPRLLCLSLPLLFGTLCVPALRLHSMRLPLSASLSGAVGLHETFILILFVASVPAAFCLYSGSHEGAAFVNEI